MPRPHGAQSTSWWTSNPATGPTGTVNIWVVARFKFLVPGRIFGARLYVASFAASYHLFSVWTAIDGFCRLQDGCRSYGGQQGPNWQNSWFRPSYRVTVNAEIAIAGLMPGGQRYSGSGFALPLTHGNIQLQDSGTTTAVDPVTASISYSSSVVQGIDVLFQPD
jgi:hypothetical protein